MAPSFGICEWALPVSGPLAIRLAHEAGYEGIQIGEAGGRQMAYPLNQPYVQRAYREGAAQYGMTLHSLNLGALLAEGAINHAPGTERGDNARRSLEKGFAACRAMDIHTVVITVDAPAKEAFDNTVAHLNYAHELAADSAVEIAIESALPLERIQALLERLDGSFRLCMDMLNPLRFRTGDPREQVCAFGVDKISHFHWKDSLAELFQAGQRGCVLLGEGDAGFRASAEVVRTAGYEGWHITENYYHLPPMNDGEGDFLALAAKDLANMREALTI